VLMTDRDDIGSLFTERIAQIRGKGVSNNDSLITLYPETRMPKPGNIHDNNIPQAVFTFKKG